MIKKHSTPFGVLRLLINISQIFQTSLKTVTTLPKKCHKFAAAGVGHLALLDANFDKASRRKHRSEQLRYSLVVDSSLCLSWDGQQGDWTHRGCRTGRLDATVLCR